MMSSAANQKSGIFRRFSIEQSEARIHFGKYVQMGQIVLLLTKGILNAFWSSFLGQGNA